MDSHQPADPWGIPEGPADDAEGVVATAPKESPEGRVGHIPDAEPEPVPEAAVSPTPRSHIPIERREGLSTTASSTFVLWGNEILNFLFPLPP